MVRVTFVAADGTSTEVDADPGCSLMEAAVGNGVDGIDAECGGNCYCGTCRVYVDAGWRDAVGPQGEFETPVIESTSDAEAGLRLSCQVTLTEALDGLVVRLPASQT